MSAVLRLFGMVTVASAFRKGIPTPAWPPFIRVQTSFRLCLATLSLALPRLSADDTPLPPHPTLVYADYKGKILPVVGAEKDSPVVIVDGIRRALPRNTPLLTKRATRYLEASAVLTGGITKRTDVALRGWDTRVTSAVQAENELSITATESLPDCYLVVIIFELNPPAGTNPADQEYSIIGVQEVGSLEAGNPKSIAFGTEVTFPTRYADKPLALEAKFTVLRTFYLLFSEGKEVRTHPPAYASEFFYRRERLAHRMIVDAWLKVNKAPAVPAEPILKIRPLIDTTEDLPQPASATFTLAADGTVTNVTLDQVFPESVANALTTTLRAWLFRPEIKNGKPVASHVRIPLQL